MEKGNKTSMQLGEQARQIRSMLKMGAISLAGAKEMLKPFEEAYNKRAVEIAKEYGTTPKKFNASAFLR